MKWIKSTLTDNYGEFDVGQILAPVAVVGMLGLEAWAIVVNHQAFSANDLGIGIGAVLTGLAAWKFGDAKSPRPPA